jgi:hypothetical protein
MKLNANLETESDSWTLETVAQDDPRLPKPRGQAEPERNISLDELTRLMATKRLGGLVKQTV